MNTSVSSIAGLALNVTQTLTQSAPAQSGFVVQTRFHLGMGMADHLGTHPVLRTSQNTTAAVSAITTTVPTVTVTLASATPIRDPTTARSNNTMSDLNATTELSGDDDDTFSTAAIPVSHTGCTDWTLPEGDIKGAVQDMIDWSNAGGENEGMRVEVKYHGRAAAYLCNCKWDYNDKAPAGEMWEFVDRLGENCGAGRSGWIFSKHWQKGYAVASSMWVEQTVGDDERRLCPTGCTGK